MGNNVFYIIILSIEAIICKKKKLTKSVQFLQELT